MCDIELADHVALVGLVVAQVVVAVFDDGVIIQGPGASGGRRSFDIADQEDGLIGVHHLLTEGGQDFWSTICNWAQGNMVVKLKLSHSAAIYNLDV